MSLCLTMLLAGSTGTDVNNALTSWSLAILASVCLYYHGLGGVTVHEGGI